MYKRRIKIFMGIIAVVFVVVVARLWQLQVIAGEEFRRRVEKALRADEPLPPATRGRIMDRRGEFLAIDKPCHEFCLDYRFLTDDERWVRAEKRRIARQENVSAALAENIYAERSETTWRLAAQAGNVTREDLDEAARRIVRRVQAIAEIVSRESGGAITEIREQRQAHPVITGLDDMAATALKARLGETVGAEVRPGFVRYYPHGELACHVIGVTGQVSAIEQKGLNIPPGEGDRLARALNDYFGGDLIGKTGVERMCEPVLRSRRGYCMRKRRLDGYQILYELPPRPGQDVKLTLDHVLQKRLTELFVGETGRKNADSGARRGDRPSNGAVVVLSVPEGEVLAMVSIPTYDLNRYHSDYRSLVEDGTDLLLLNRAVGRLYPIGSTAKAMAALAGLAEGAIGPQTHLVCDGRFRVGRELYLHCWTAWRNMPGHGPLNVSGALKQSCNIFFYQVGYRLGLEKLSRWFVRLGFAERSGTGLPQEKAGTVPTEEWLKRYNERRVARGRPLYRPVPIDAMQVAIGQGFLAGTPLHVANAMAAIARGGRFGPPLLVKEGQARGERQVRELGVDPAFVRLVKEGMYRVVNETGGTAYKVFHTSGAAPLDADVFGKTGTATAPPADTNGDGRIDAYERDRNEMAWFAGFALLRDGSGRLDDGRRGIAFAVVVEYVKGGGSSNAGPIAREAIRAWLEICRED